MYIWRTKVPVGVEIIIGYDNGNNHDFVGFIEEGGSKKVKVEESIYDDLAESTCKSCDIYFSRSKTEAKYKESYKHLFLAHPEMCVDFLETTNLQNLLENSYFYYTSSYQHVYRPYANVMSVKYFVDLLVKWNDYEKFVNTLVKTWQFEQKVLSPVAHNIYKNYNKCKGYLFEDRKCRKDVLSFDKNVTCSHNILIWTQQLWDDKYYLYDNYTDNVCSLPNIYDDGCICWGSRKNPQNLSDAHCKFWSAPFNGDLLRDVNSAESMIAGYGFELSDFYPYDDDSEKYDYDAEPRPFTAQEIIQIIRQGGDNSGKGRMDLVYDSFNIPGVTEILVVEDGREKITDFADIISEDFLTNGCTDNLYLFLINEVPDKSNVWTAYLPTNTDDGEYIEIDLVQLATYTGDTEDDDSH